MKKLFLTICLIGAMALGRRHLCRWAKKYLLNIAGVSQQDIDDFRTMMLTD